MLILLLNLLSMRDTFLQKMGGDFETQRRGRESDPMVNDESRGLMTMQF